MVLEFKTELVKDKHGRILFKKFSKQGKEYYYLRIWLEGGSEELDQIETVHYRLHDTFPNHPTINDRVTNFQLGLWAWGMFDIVATITNTDGTAEIKQFFLEWDLPTDDGSNYILMSRDFVFREGVVIE